MNKQLLWFCMGILLLVCNLGSAALAAVPMQSSPPAAEEAKIDLNTAGQQQLEELPGIGPRTAERIIQFREENGPFRRIEDLMNVRGIGEKKFERLKDRIRVSQSKASSAPDS